MDTAKAILDLEDQYASGEITDLELAQLLAQILADMLLIECKQEFEHNNPGMTYRVKQIRH